MANSEFRHAIEHGAKKCSGHCRRCGAPYGGRTEDRDVMDLAAWLFAGYCSNLCRRLAGEPEQFDLEEAARRVWALSDSN